LSPAIEPEHGFFASVSRPDAIDTGEVIAQPDRVTRYFRDAGEAAAFRIPLERL
jgi:hypothetical protein